MLSNASKLEVRELYWSHLIEIYFDNCKKSKMPVGFTRNRLKEIKPFLLKNNAFWFDVISRHGDYENPQDMKNKDKYAYEHSMGNMSGMIFEFMIKYNILKV